MLVSRRRVLAGAMIIAALVAPASAPAEEAVAPTREILVRWTHTGDAAGFKIYTRFIDRGWDEGLDVGRPPARDGVHSHVLTVSNFDAVYVSVTAYDRRGRETAHSNEKLYLLPQ